MLGGPCRTRCPGPPRGDRGRCRPRPPPPTAPRGTTEPPRRHRRSADRPASSWAPPACASGRGPHRCAATTPNMAGSAPALTSFTTSAPAATASSATAALRVSTDRTASGAARRSPSSTGSTRLASSSASTGSDPGRVDSPPTSSTSAPSSRSRSPCRTAASASSNSPPSLNESGVTFTMPITSVRSSSGSSRSRQRHTSPIGEMVVAGDDLSACRCGPSLPGASARRSGTARGRWR